MTPEKTVFTVTDLGGGDGGKGGVVHKICTQKKAHTVIKVGGAQGSHGVRTNRGESFNFSQFGCGTFEGVRTHISPRMVIDPHGILNEGMALMYEHGVRDAFNLLTVDAHALSITPYHGIASRLRELARKDKPKGTIGIGVGEAYTDSKRNPDLALYAHDLGSPRLRDTIAAVREHKIRELAPVIEQGFLQSDMASVEKQITLLRDEGLIDWTVERFTEMRKRVRIVDSEFMSGILSRPGTVVVESSHGILTDYYYGFHPHTSALRTLPCFTHDMLRAHGYDGNVVRLGITRGYTIRHGAGPMVTEFPSMLDTLLPGSSKEENRYQGKVRVGPLDLVALRYAIAVCGGPASFDGLAITWFDQITKAGTWSLCDSYENVNPKFFASDRDIIVRRGEDQAQLDHQRALGIALGACIPRIDEIPVPNTKELTISLCDTLLKEKLSLPVRMISFGATENEKVCF